MLFHDLFQLKKGIMAATRVYINAVIGFIMDKIINCKTSIPSDWTESEFIYIMICIIIHNTANPPNKK